MLEVIVQKEGLKFLGWRTLPTHPEEIGDKAVERCLYIMQGFIGKPAEVEKDWTLTAVCMWHVVYLSRATTIRMSYP